MSTERSPEEWAEEAVMETSVRLVLDAAVNDYASWMVAEENDLDPDVCERWVNILWNNLRDRLDDEERLKAIMLLIHPAAVARAVELVSVND